MSHTLLDLGDEVYGLSRRGWPDEHSARLFDKRCDLAEREAIAPALSSLLTGVRQLELVILNAGILGPIQDMAETSLEQLDQIMQINVWSNKLILDWLIQSGIIIDQIVLISSGAAVNGNRGWGGYALSKATLNMLTQLYAHEFPDTHLSALAPGLIDTAMQDQLCDPEQVDGVRFSSVNRLRAAHGTEAMPNPQQAAEQILQILPRLRQLPSGQFCDIRQMPDR